MKRSLGCRRELLGAPSQARAFVGVPESRSSRSTVRPVRRLEIAALVLALAAAVAGCGGDSGGSDLDESARPTTAAAAVTTVPVPTTGAAATGPPTDLTLRITGVRLINSEESDSGMRVLLPSGVPSASVTLTGLPSPNRVVSVCQARELERRMSVAVCRMPASGEAVTVALGSAASGVEIVQVGVAGSGPAGNTLALDDVTVRYAAFSREMSVRLPQIAAGESGGTPTFGLTPASGNGVYRATLNWTVIPVFGGTDSTAQLALVEPGGGTGQTRTGSGQVEFSGNVPPPVGNVDIRVQNTGSAAMVGPTLTVLLP